MGWKGSDGAGSADEDWQDRQMLGCEDDHDTEWENMVVPSREVDLWSRFVGSDGRVDLRRVWRGDLSR